jgi:pimeloyl-ACP methyl ester carboxylesterase
LISEQQISIQNPATGGRAMAVFRGFLALLCVVASAESQPLKAQSSQRVALASCRLPGVDGEARCGSYEVYEDRRARKGRRIALKIAVLPALGSKPSPDALFILAGGPGQAATENADFIARVFAKVREERDIVMVDQRGTGGSNGLRCDLYGASLRAYLGDLLPIDAIKVCRAEWGRRADLRLYTTPIAMDDLDEARAALGYERINLFGTSYGTRAAQVYMRQHPGRVRSVILKGVTPASDNFPRVIARDAQRSLDLVFDDCAKNEACRQAFPNLKREFADVLARFEKGGVMVEIPDVNKTGAIGHVELSRGAFATTLRSLLQGAPTIAQLPMMIHQAYNGDYAPFVNNTLSIRDGASKGLSYGMFLSVVNTEDLPLTDPKQVERESAGTFMGDYYYRQIAQAGKLIPSGAAPPNYKEPVRSKAPVLIVSGYLDPATPPENGDKIARHLPNSLHVVARYGSHGYSTNFLPCVDQLMADFIARGGVKGLDISCIDRIPQIPFQVPSNQAREKEED